MSEYEVLDEKGKRVDQSETIPHAGLVTGSVEGERGSGGRESNSEREKIMCQSSGASAPPREMKQDSERESKWENQRWPWARGEGKAKKGKESKEERGPTGRDGLASGSCRGMRGVRGHSWPNLGR